MRLTAPTRRMLLVSLEGAFSPDTLNTLLLQKFELKPEDVVADSARWRRRLLEIVRYFEAQNTAEKLIEAARDARPEEPQFARILEMLATACTLQPAERITFIYWCGTVDRDTLDYCAAMAGCPQPDELVGPASMKSDLAAALVTWLDSNIAAAPLLFQEAVKLTPAHDAAAALTAAAERLDAVLAAAQTRQPLPGLNTLASAPESRRLVAEHRAELTRFLGYTQRVSDLKRLHDLVDQLRRFVFFPMRLLANRFPDAGSMLDLNRCSQKFRELQRTLIDASAGKDLPDGVGTWIAEDLPAVGDALTTALRDRLPASLAEAVNILRTIIETELTGLDRDLALAAQDLNLEALIKRFRVIQDEARRLGVPEARQVALERDVTGLEGVSQQLADLVRQHGAWQRIDTYLNVFENMMNDSATALATPWRLAVTRLRALMERTEVPGLQAAVDALGAAVAAGDLYEIILRFPDLSTLVRDHFFALDRALLAECDKVSAIGEGLRAIVEGMDG